MINQQQPFFPFFPFFPLPSWSDSSPPALPPPSLNLPGSSSYYWYPADAAPASITYAGYWLDTILLCFIKSDVIPVNFLATSLNNTWTFCPFRADISKNMTPLSSANYYASSTETYLACSARSDLFPAMTMRAWSTSLRALASCIHLSILSKLSLLVISYTTTTH